MKIRILDAIRMGVSKNLNDGDIIDVVPYGEDGDNLEGFKIQEPIEYLFLAEWEGIHFEIVEEDVKISNVKIRINNPDHSKAVQEWLFDRGASWPMSGKVFKDYGEKYGKSISIPMKQGVLWLIPAMLRLHGVFLVIIFTVPLMKNLTYNTSIHNCISRRSSVVG